MPSQTSEPNIEIARRDTRYCCVRFKLLFPEAKTMLTAILF